MLEPPLLLNGLFGGIDSIVKRLKPLIRDFKLLDSGLSSTRKRPCFIACLWNVKMDLVFFWNFFCEKKNYCITSWFLWTCRCGPCCNACEKYSSNNRQWSVGVLGYDFSQAIRDFLVITSGVDKVAGKLFYCRIR